MTDAQEGASVRPGDLGATDDGGTDVLAGWDLEGAVPGRLERPPFPFDTVVVAASALVGAVLGGGGRRGSRGRRTALGALLGAVVAGAARRVWRSP